MSNVVPNERKTGLDKAIADIFREMDLLSSETDEYAHMADQLVKLYSLKEKDSQTRVSPDTLALVISNLVGIIFIVAYERTHVMATKALPFLKVR